MTTCCIQGTRGIEQRYSYTRLPLDKVETRRKKRAQKRNKVEEKDKEEKITLIDMGTCENHHLNMK